MRDGCRGHSGERGLRIAFHWPCLGLHTGQASLGE